MWNYLGPFSVKEEEEDLSKDLLRLKVNFREVLEEEEEDAALVDFLSQLHLQNIFEKRFYPDFKMAPVFLFLQHPKKTRVVAAYLITRKSLICILVFYSGLFYRQCPTLKDRVKLRDFICIIRIKITELH